MPYYFDWEDESYWDDEYRKRYEASRDDGSDLFIGYEVPKSLFKYVEPWQAKTTVLSFSDTPGPEPEMPENIPYQRIPYPRKAVPAPSRGFFARLFGTKPAPAPAAERPQRTREQWLEATRVHALWSVSWMAARCRDRGVKRVFGSYDGGNDESFTRFTGIEMRDGRVMVGGPRWVRGVDVDCESLVDVAVWALMGGCRAGDFSLHGVLTIDAGACTITDEKNFDVVFGHKKPWEI
jgi:hypothetical protein